MKGTIMATERVFTKEERAELLSNPYTLYITEHGKICFTFEFKQFVWQEIQNGLSPKRVFEKAGYDYKLIGYSRGDRYVENVKAEGNSEAGLIDKTPKTAHKNFTKKHSQAAIKELQDRVLYLEAQIDFLKKIAHLDKMNELEK